MRKFQIIKKIIVVVLGVSFGFTECLLSRETSFRVQKKVSEVKARSGGYTLDVNKELVQLGGRGLARSVYYGWLYDKPENTLISELTLKNFKYMIRHPKEDALFVKYLKYRESHLNRKVKLFINHGISWSPELRYNVVTKSDSELAALTDGLVALYPGAVVVARDPVGMFNDNVPKIKDQLKKELSQGSDLVFVSFSKGSLELLKAYSLLIEEFGGEWPESYGRAIFSLHFVGCFGGATMTYFEPTDQVSKLARVVPWKDHSAFIQFAASGGQLNEEFVTGQLKEIRKSLPSSLVLHSVHAVPENGRFESRTVYKSFMLYKSLKMIGLDWAAGDSTFFYPNTQLKESLGFHTTDSTIDASHVVGDGNYQGYSFYDADNFRMYVVSLFSGLIASQATEEIRAVSADFLGQLP